MALPLLLALLLTAASAAAQTTSELTGAITDATGAAIPGVQLAVINTATNARRETQTNDAGLYRFPFLPPGIYRVEATKDGF
ncbi:MAG: carboxypeptidase regulatory-like domain-containing protein, partial [Bryobacterales bacterium]|nr:carboxypeptidase regulatory-like domain-containing protein [Bryobacterales bacterium]